VAAGRPLAGSEIMADLSVVPAGATARVELASVSGQDYLDGVRTLRPARDGGGLEPATIASEGRLVHEVDGPGTLWAAGTALPPLAMFFPTLPESTAVGSEVRWELRLYAASTTLKIKRRRLAAARAGKTLPEPLPKIHAVPLAILGWATLGDTTRIALLGGEWSLGDDRYDRDQARRLEKWRAHYVISERGVLLHAALVGNTDHWWSSQPGEAGASAGHVEHELRLVEACAGPALERMAWSEAPTKVESARPAGSTR
jgi:hypothetical protein